MALFDSWFAPSDPFMGTQGGASQPAQMGGFQNPNDNITSKLAALAKMLQAQGAQQAQQQTQGLPQAPMLPPVTFGAPGAAAGAGAVDMSRGPSVGRNDGY